EHWIVQDQTSSQLRWTETETSESMAEKHHNGNCGTEIVGYVKVAFLKGLRDVDEIIPRCDIPLLSVDIYGTEEQPLCSRDEGIHRRGQRYHLLWPTCRYTHS